MPIGQAPQPGNSGLETIEGISQKVQANAERVKQLGSWPDHVKAESLVERIPKIGDKDSPGFDAGIACALDLIERGKQKLSATLHGAYTPEAVEQVRKEIENLDPDSETCWWLAACYVCQEGDIDQKKFLGQIETFKSLAKNPGERARVAKEEFARMTSKFYFTPELGEDVPYGTEDGSQQGAYIKGYPFAVLDAKNYGLYFVGTYHESLGLEDFPWSEEKDEKGRPKSGPVWGSKQFIKCANMDELKRVLAIVKPKFEEELQKAKQKQTGSKSE